tara:strand:+ start:2291 stop:2419 length:129 start_codon:yes stop_codon:yes gene_type:complete
LNKENVEKKIDFLLKELKKNTGVSDMELKELKKILDIEDFSE